MAVCICILTVPNLEYASAAASYTLVGLRFGSYCFTAAAPIQGITETEAGFAKCS